MSLNPKQLAEAKEMIRESYHVFEAVVEHHTKGNQKTLPIYHAVCVLLQNAQFDGSGTVKYEHKDAVDELESINKLLKMIADHDKSYMTAWASQIVDCALIVAYNSENEADQPTLSNTVAYPFGIKTKLKLPMNTPFGSFPSANNNQIWYCYNNLSMFVRTITEGCCVCILSTAEPSEEEFFPPRIEICKPGNGIDTDSSYQIFIVTDINYSKEETGFIMTIVGFDKKQYLVSLNKLISVEIRKI